MFISPIRLAARTILNPPKSTPLTETPSFLPSLAGDVFQRTNPASPPRFGGGEALKTPVEGSSSRALPAPPDEGPSKSPAGLPERFQKRSQQSKAMWAGKEFKEKQRQKLKESWKDPERLQKRSQQSKAMWKTSEFREKQIQKRKGAQRKPVSLEKRAQREPSAYVKYLIQNEGLRNADEIVQKLMEKFPEKVRIIQGKSFPPVTKSQIQGRLLDEMPDPPEAASTSAPLPEQG